MGYGFFGAQGPEGSRLFVSSLVSHACYGIGLWLGVRMRPVVTRSAYTPSGREGPSGERPPRSRGRHRGWSMEPPRIGERERITLEILEVEGNYPWIDREIKYCATVIARRLQ
jgi:hypothetical protein